MFSEYAYTFVIAAGFALSAFGWGASLSRRRLDADLLEYVTVRFVIGCGAVYALCMALSAVRLMTRVPVACVLIVGMGLSIVDAEPLWQKVRGAQDDIRKWGPGYRWLLGAVMLTALLQLACGLSPLVFYDALVYHIAAPAEFLRQGWLAHIPWNVSSDTPIALQLTAGSSLALDETGAAFKLILTLFGTLMAIGAALLVKRVDHRAALWAALFVLTYPEFWVQQALGVVDLGGGAMVVLGAAWLWNAIQDEQWNWLIPAGIAFGFAVSSRYQNLPLVLLVTGFTLVQSRSIRVVSRCVITLGLIGAVMLAP